MGKYQEWYDAQPKHVQEWMKKQAVWNDRDLALYCSIALAIGWFIGFLVR